jgi:hypothetical protein
LSGKAAQSALLHEIGGHMKTVVLHKDFACAPDGHTVFRFRAGDILTGNAAELALADDAGHEPQSLEVKVIVTPETKGRRK